MEEFWPRALNTLLYTFYFYTFDRTRWFPLLSRKIDRSNSAKNLFSITRRSIFLTSFLE